MASALEDQSNGTHLAEVKTRLEKFTQEAIARAALIYKKSEHPGDSVLPYCVPKEKKRKVNHSSR
jgi:hypothetical protein